MRAAIDGQPAPPCPGWCKSHSPSDEQWTEHPAATTKTCRRVIHAGEDADGYPVTVTIERFADIDETGAVRVQPTTIDIHADGPLSVAGAVRLAETVLRVSEIIDMPAMVA